MAVVANDLLLYKCSTGAAPDDTSTTIGGAIAAGTVSAVVDDVFATIAANTSGGADKTRYAKVFYKNTNSTTTLTGAKIWVATTASSGHVWAMGTGGASDTTTQGTAPGGVSFTDQPGTTAGQLTVGDIAAGGAIPLWLRVVLTAGTAPLAATTMGIRILGNTA